MFCNISRTNKYTYCKLSDKVIIQINNTLCLSKDSSDESNREILLKCISDVENGDVNAMVKLATAHYVNVENNGVIYFHKSINESLPNICILLTVASLKNDLWAIVELAKFNKLVLKNNNRYEELMNRASQLILDGTKFDEYIASLTVIYLQDTHQFLELKQICEIAIAERVEYEFHKLLLAIICWDGIGRRNITKIFDDKIVGIKIDQKRSIKLFRELIEENTAEHTKNLAKKFLIFALNNLK